MSRCLLTELDVDRGTTYIVVGQQELQHGTRIQASEHWQATKIHLGIGPCQFTEFKVVKLVRW